ncbi:DUF6354 family protein [Streptomyces syringium]|uniref:DUF6354 family protein n=1 Tax=Streptomyces syringium TaxID=76729 RepID=UPI0037D6B415
MTQEIRQPDVPWAPAHVTAEHLRALTPPRCAVLLAAITAVHGPEATPDDYARAAFHALPAPAVAAP